MYEGTPRPYSVGTDDAVTILMMAGIAVLIAVFAFARHTMAQQAKTFFYNTGDARDLTSQLSKPVAVLALLCCNMMAVASLIGADATEGGIENSTEPIAMLAAYMAFFMAYYALKWLVYNAVNMILFDRKKTLQWNQAFFFIIATTGVMLLPVVMAAIYLHLDNKTALILLIIVLFLNKIMAFYKTNRIFFNKKHFLLQNILYLCTLEIMPLLAASGLWQILTSELKINF